MALHAAGALPLDLHPPVVGKVPHQDLEASIELYQTRYVLVAYLWLWCMGG